MATVSETGAAALWGKEPRVIVGKRGPLWGWSCPCCLNFPDKVIYYSWRMAMLDAYGHVERNHTDVDWACTRGAP